MRFRSLALAVVGSALLWLVGCGSSASFPATTQLLVAVADGDPNAGAGDGNLRGRETEVRDEVLTSRGTTRFTFNPFDGVNLVLVRDEVEYEEDGTFYWYGHVDGVDDSDATFSDETDSVCGVVRSAGKVYAVSDVTGPQVVTERNPHYRWIEPAYPKGGPKPPARRQTAATDNGTVIDILVAYTTAAKTKAGGLNGIKSQISLCVAQTNRSFRHSEVGTQLRLVKTQEVSYNEAGFQFSRCLDQMGNPTDGVLDQLPVLRDRYAADIVVLLVAANEDIGTGTVEGLAQSPSGPPSDDYADQCYAAVSLGSAATDLSFAHEVAHVFGCDHDPANSSNPIYPYAQGYITAAFRTIMAYGSDTAGPVVEYYSNPRVRYGGVPTGLANSADNALVLQRSRLGVANYRRSATATAKPGT